MDDQYEDLKPKNGTPVNTETATKDVNRWLDYKKTTRAQREAYAGIIDNIIKDVEDGYIEVNDDCTLTVKLRTPTDGDAPITHLTIKPRTTVRAVEEAVKRHKASAQGERLKAIIALQSGVHYNVVMNLDTVDGGILDNIALFFL